MTSRLVTISYRRVYYSHFSIHPASPSYVYAQYVRPCVHGVSS